MTDPDSKGQLGAKTRERKQLKLTLEELRTIWKSRLTADERAALERVLARELELPGRDPDAAFTAMAFAVAHSFERSSVIPVKRLLATALRHGVGQTTVNEITEEQRGHGLLIRDYQGERLASTKEVLAEET